jgi:beta-phosphoglucomutase-like phosphatase (HAD superfamily)
LLEAARCLNVAPSRGILLEDALDTVQARHCGSLGWVAGMIHGDQAAVLLNYAADVVVRDLSKVMVASS